MNTKDQVRNIVHKIFVKDWQTKLLSLIISLALWFTISLSQSTVTNYPGRLKINFTNLKDGLIAIANDESVQIKINTEPVNLSKVKESDFKVQIDLDTLTEGTYEKSVTVTSSNKNVQIISVNPSKTTVRIEKKTTKTVPIRIRLDGQAGDEMIASEAKSNPSEAIISGPESTVNSTTEVVAPIKLDGQKENFEKTAQLFAYEAQGTEIKNLTIEPSYVNVNVTISPSGDTRTVGIKVNTEGKIADGYWISAISTDPQVLTITGSRTKLSQTRYLETEMININGLSESKTFSAKISAPSGIAIQDKPQSIKVVLNIEKLAINKEFEISPSFVNLPSNLIVSKSEPNKVRVAIGSSGKDIATLNSDQIKLNIDLSSVSAGQKEIDIFSQNFSLPNGFDIVAIKDNKITLQLTNK